MRLVLGAWKSCRHRGEGTCGRKALRESRSDGASPRSLFTPGSFLWAEPDSHRAMQWNPRGLQTHSGKRGSELGEQSVIFGTETRNPARGEGGYDFGQGLEGTLSVLGVSQSRLFPGTHTSPGGWEGSSLLGPPRSSSSSSSLQAPTQDSCPLRG